MVRQRFRKLMEPILADPERRAAFETERRAMEVALTLASVREAKGAMQSEVADTLAVSRANVSRIEHQDDLYLSTLRSYVEALGGRLKLVAVFPDGSVELVAPPATCEDPEAYQPAAATPHHDAGER